MWFMYTIGVLTLVLAVLAVDYLRKKHRQDAFEKLNIGGPTAWPIVGCALEVITLSPEDIINFIGTLFNQFGKTVRFWILNEAQIYTKDISYFESILSSTTLLRKGDLYRVLTPFLNDGLLLSVGKKWHSRRKVFTPAFHFKALEHYVDVFDEQSGVLAQQLQKFADGKTVLDLIPVVCLAALDVITEAAMGVKVNAQFDPNFPYIKALKRVVYVQPNRMLKMNARHDWMFKLLAPFEYRELMKDIATMQNFTINVIEKRRAELERSIADGTYQPLKSADDDIGSKQQMTFLDILLQARIDGKPLTNENIREEVDTFMFEGDDTTTSGVSHALYCISRHPKVQEKLFNEIIKVLGTDKDAPVNMQKLNELPYTECVIKETLRMFPPVPAIGRKADHDIDLNGRIIPANTSIYLVTIWAHRDPDNFKDPESFIPERFEAAAERELNRNAYTYTPFSAGPKNCIGQKFAMLEMKAMITKVLRHYELLPLGPDAEPMMNLILRSSTGCNVGLKPRVY